MKRTLPSPPKTPAQRTAAHRIKPRPLGQSLARLKSTVAVCAALMAAAGAANAATYSWNVDADGVTSLDSNWLGGLSPNGIGFAGDILNFTNALSAARLVTIDGSVTAGMLNIGDTTTTNAFTLASTADGILIMDASLGSAVITKASGADANDIISTNILFKDTLDITNNSATGTLTLSGPLRSVTSDITFNGTGALATGSIDVTGVITTAGDLIKNDVGVIRLGGANTYAGATIINGGTLLMANASAIPQRSAVTVASGATLSLGDVNRTLGSLTGEGIVTNPTALGNRTLTVGRDDTSTTFNGQFVGTPGAKGRLAITKIGAGTLTLAPLSGSSATAAGDYTGATIINGGAIELDFSQGTFSGASMLAATPLQLAGGDFMMTGRAGLASNQLLGALTVGATGGSITMVPGDVSGTLLRLGGVTATASGGALLITAPANTTVRLGTSYAATSLNNRLVFSDGTANSFNWAVNTGANTDTTGFAAYTTLPTTGGATNTAYNLTASQTQTGATTIRSLKLSSTSAGTQTLDLDTFTMTLGGTATASPGAILIDGTDGWNIDGTTGTLKQANTAATGDLIFQQYSTGTVTVNAGIVDNATVAAATTNLVKAGPGLLTLAGTNTFTGTVFVNGGTLSFNNAGASGTGTLGLGIATAVTIRDGATLQYTGATATLASATTANSHTFALQGGNANIEVTSGAASLTLAGVISGAGGFTKLGAGELILSGAETYTGPTFINAGTLTISAADRIPSTPLTIGASGTFNMAAGNETVGILSGSGTVQSATSGTARTFTVGADNTSATFSGTLSGALGNVFNKTGSGIQTIALASPTVWTGSSNVQQGVIRLGNNNGMPSTGTWTIANSASVPAQIDLNGFNWTTSGTSGITFYGTTSNANSQGSINIGTGTLTLGGSGSITVNFNGNPQQATIDATGVGGIVMTAQRTFNVLDSTSVPANRAELLINSNISGTGGGIIKSGSGNLRLVGGTNTTTGTNRFDSGITWLDYSIDNTAKLGTGALDMRGGTLVVEGNASAATAETVASLTLPSGASTLTINAYGGQDASLTLGLITRGTAAGTIRFELPAGTQTATHGFITNTTNNPITGLLGTTGAGFATVTDATGTWFAQNSTNAPGGNVVPVVSTPKDDVTMWTAAQNVTGSSGYSGTLGFVANVNSIRFNAPSVTSTVTLPDGGVLNIVSGGVLQTSNATGGSSIITGGTLRSSAGDELIFTADSDQIFNVASRLTGTTSLTKAGDGSLRLSGNTNYATDSTGNVKLYAGTLRVDGGHAIGDNATLTIGGTHSSIFDLLASETIGTLATGGNAQTLNSSVTTLQTEIALNDKTLTINQGATGTFSGFFSDSGTGGMLIKSGSGTLAINANSTGNFTGSVVVNQEQLQFNGGGGGLSGVTSWTVNGTGNLYSNKDSTTTADAIGNAVSITLNSTNQGGAAFNGEGLIHRTNQGNTRAETVGGIVFGAGHNTVTAYGNATNAVADLIVGTSSGITRNATTHATALVRGNALGASSGTRGQIRVSNATGNTALDGEEVGGGGAAASTNISIIPWLVGDLLQTGLGNTFVTNTVVANGLRPLASSEYISDSLAITGALTDNIRYTTGGTITGAPTAINSLVLDGGTGFTLSGPASSMAITSGALLSAQGVANVIDTFTGITTPGSTDYTVYVTDPSGSLTLTSPLTSANALVKSGAGALILDSASNAFTDLYFNQGVVQADALNKLGSGDFNFYGGTLKFTGVYDPSGKTIRLGTGGATLDTNGNNISLANPIGNSGAGGLTKTGAGSLTLAAPPLYGGDTSVENGSLIINSGNTIPSTGLTLGSGSGSGVVQLGDSGAGTVALTVTSLATSGSGTTNAIVGGGAAGSVLTVNQVTTTTYAGDIGGVGSNQNNLGIIKTGVGALTLSGATLSYTGETTLNGGTLNFTGSPSAALATSGVTLARGTTLNLVNTAGQAINVGAGTLSLGASGTGTTVLGLELGSTGAYDSINTSGAAVASGNVLFNLTGLSGFGAGTYDLLTAASGLDSATYFIGDISGSLVGVTLALTTDPTFVRLGATASTGTFYWQGGVDTSWLGNSGLNTNFTTDLAGTTNANGTPGATSTVIYSTTNNLQGPAVSTTLDADFTINDLQFNSNPSGVTSVTIAAGTPTTSSLTIAPSSPANGIVVGSNAGAVTISAPLVLGADQTWDVDGTGANGSSLTVSSAITGAADLIKIGAGTVTLSNASSAYVGTTTVSDGVLQAGIANGFNNTSAHVIGASGTLRLNNFSSTIGSLAGAGTVENSGTGTDVLTAGGDNTSTTFSGVLQDGASGLLGLTKLGTGTLTLSGSASTLTGTVAVHGGILQTTGTFTNVTGGTQIALLGGANSGMLYVPSGSYTTGSTIIGADSAGDIGVGSLVVNGGDFSATAITLGGNAANAGYNGLFLLSGSVASLGNVDIRSTETTPTSVGVLRVDGGTLTTSAFILSRNGKFEFTVTGGVVDNNPSTNNIALGYNGPVGNSSVMNVTGGLVDNTGRSITIRENGSTPNVSINLNGGQVITNTIQKNNAAGTGVLNFNGGTLTPGSTGATLVANTNGLVTYVNGAFGAFNGGVVIDTAGNNTTISAALLDPTGLGDGVSGLSVGGVGSGYIGAPIVEFSGGGGTGATGYAVVDLVPASGTFGQVTGIVLTNPGIGYTGTPTVTLTGGLSVGGVAATATAAGTTANSSGGLTKNGAGILTLSGANTYTAGTTINAGTVALGANDVLANSGNVTILGGTLDVNSRNDTVATVSLQSGGSITGTTGVLTSTANYDLRSGSASAILAGSVGVTKTTAGTVTLSGANTFSGAINVNGGTLEFSASNHLGDASVTNTIGIDGGTLSLITPTTVNLGATRVVTIGSGGATLNTDFALGVLNLQGGITATSATSDLTKTGPGTVTVTGSTNLMGSAVTVSGGTLNAGFTDSISGITLSGGGALNLFDGAAITNNITTLNLGSGNTLGFDLGVPGTNDLLALTTNAASLGGSLILNFTNIGGFAAGTYTVITDAVGGLSTNPGADYSIGVAPSGLNLSFLTSDANNLILTASALNLVYWQGDQDNSWITDNAGNTNWASDAAGTTDLGALPVATDTLVFSATNATGPSFTTTLDASRTADSLQFLAAPVGVTDFTINQGAGGTLTLTPISSNNGISVADNAGVITIAAPLTTGAAQTWEVIGTGANGSSLTINGDVTFTNVVTKTGAGALTLGGAGANTGAGGLVLAGGTLNLGKATAFGTGNLTIGPGVSINNTSGGALTLTNNNTQTWNGSFGFTGTNSLNIGTGAITLGANIVLSAAANTLTVGGVIDDGASAFDLTKFGAGTLVLGGNNGYDGLTNLLQGTLTLAGDNSGAAGGVTMAASTTLNIAHNNAGTTNALGTGTFTIDGGTLDNTSGSAITANGGNNLQNWNGNFTFTGTNDLNLGSGAVTLGATTAVTVSANTLTAGAVADGAGTFGVTKNGTGTLVLGGLSTFDGATVIGNGTLRFASGTQALTSATNTLIFGASAGSTSLGTLDLSTASATFGGATIVQSNSNTANSISIGASQTLQLNGVVTIGYNSGAVTTTKLNVTGLGTFSIGDSGTPTNAGVTIGGNTTTNVSNKATLDLSGVSTFYANLGTGTFRVGDATNAGGGAGTGGGGSTLILAPDSTILATTLTSDGAPTGVTQAIKLGSSSNTIWANTITIGAAANRSNATLDFNSGTGTLQVRALNGIGRAAFNVANGSTATGSNPVATVDLTGHSVDLLLSTLTIGGRSAGTTGSSTGTFTFDTGTLDATTVVVATRTGTTPTTSDITGTLNLMASGGSGAVTITTLNMGINSVSTATTNGQSKPTLNIGGTGTVGITTLTMANNSIGGGATAQTDAPVTSIVNISGSTTTVNTLNMNTNSSANTGTGNASLSNLNISGGTLNVGTGSGTPLNMANASNANATATSTISITATGTLNMNGNLAYTAGVGTENTTLTLNGGTLDMGGFNIGALATPVGSGTGALNFQSGTLRNVNEINGGADLVKTTGGTLLMNTSNAYTGATTVSAGILQITDGGALGGTSVGTSVTSGAALEISGSITTTAEALTLNGSGIGGTGALRNTSGSNTYSGAVVLQTDSAVGVATSSDTLTLSDVISGAGGLTKVGAGKLAFTGASANTYTGVTTVSAGELQLNKTAGVNAITGDGLADTLTDVLINGGTLRLLASNQIADTTTITQTSGAFRLNGKAETIGTYTKTGGSFSTGIGGSLTLLGNTFTVTGPSTLGDNVIDAEASLADTSVTLQSGAILEVYGSNNAAYSPGPFGTFGGTLQINTGGTGLTFADGANTLNLDSDATTTDVGKLVLQGDVNTTGTGTATIASVGGGTVKGLVDLSGGTRTFTVAAGNPLTVSAVIDNGGLTKAGAGTVTLTAANTYSALTSVDAGVLNIQNNDALGTTAGGTTVGAGATLQLEKNPGGLAIGAEALSLSGSGAAGQNGALVNLQGANSYAGAITLAANSTIASDADTLALSGAVALGAHTLTSTGAGGQTTITGDITGTGGLDVTVVAGGGAHTLTLNTGTNTFTGETTITGVGSDDANLSVGLNSLNSTSGVTVNGGGTLFLTDNGSNGRINDSATMTLNDGEIKLGGLNVSGDSETVGALTLSATNTISIIDFQSLSIDNRLNFADSSGNAWTGSLHIYNWDGLTLAQGGGTGSGTENNQIFFGIDDTALTGTQLGQITFFSDAGGMSLGTTVFGSAGQIVPVPEPTGIAAGLALLGLAGWRERRRGNARRREERAASRN